MKLTTQDKIKIQVQFSEFFEDKTPLFSIFNFLKLIVLCILDKSMWNYGGIVPNVWYVSTKLIFPPERKKYKLIKNTEGNFEIITKPYK